MRTFFRLVSLSTMASGWAVAFMMLVGSADVAATHLFGLPIPGVLELTELAMVLGAFLALAGLQRDDGHIRVSLLLERLPASCQRSFTRAGYLLNALFFGLIAAIGWKVLFESVSVGEYSSGSLPVPVWPARLGLAFGSTLAAIEGLRKMSGRFNG